MSIDHHVSGLSLTFLFTCETIDLSVTASQGERLGNAGRSSSGALVVLELGL